MKSTIAQSELMVNNALHKMTFHYKPTPQQNLSVILALLSWGMFFLLKKTTKYSNEFLILKNKEVSRLLFLWVHK